MTLATMAESATALDVGEIFIAQRKDHWANAAAGSPYNFEVWVNGTGITSVSVTDPHGVNHSLFLEDGQWDFQDVGFASLANLDATYGPGDYMFNFNAGADSAIVNYQYIVPTGLASITYPSDGQSNVGPNPVYTWDSAEDYGDVLTLAVENPGGLGSDLYSEAPVSDTLTSWQPGPLADNTAYELQIAVSKLQDNTPQAMATNGGDDFTYYGLFDYVNRVSFETVPEPATLILLVLAGLALTVRKPA